MDPLGCFSNASYIILNLLGVKRFFLPGFFLSFKPDRLKPWSPHTLRTHRATVCVLYPNCRATSEQLLSGCRATKRTVCNFLYRRASSLLSKSSSMADANSSGFSILLYCIVQK